LDGTRTLEDLCVDFEDRFKVLAPQIVAEAVDGLERAGFAELPVLRPDVRAIFDGHGARWSRLVRGIKRVFEWEMVWSGVDPLLTRLYDGGIHLLFTRPAQIAIAVTALLGLLAFILSLGRVEAMISDLARAHILIALLPLFVLTVALHELGHGFTAKAHGREIQRIGFGWDWFVPIVFVDTSDMWTAGRWPRVAVNVAGVYVNIVLGSLAAIAAWLGPPAPAAEILLLFAAISYGLALINLNPWLDHDGYYVLIDLLDRPDLQRESFEWIRRDLVPALRSGRGLRGHWVDLLYGLGAVAYVGLIVALALFVCLRVVYPWMTTFLPSAAAMALAGLGAAIVIVLAAGGILGSFFAPSAAERSRLRNMQLGAWTTQS
jgi:putative peptide zinc metalloprotease protein